MNIKKLTMCGLIVGLPDDVALRCLAYVPYYLHQTLELVSSTWRAAVRSPDLFKLRQEVGSTEELLCLCAAKSRNIWRLYDPLSDHWITLPILPSKIRHLSGFGTVSTSGKLFVLGGGNREIHPRTGYIGDRFATNEVWSFDFATCRWTQQAPMLVPRSRFACCVMDGKIVVAGGFTSYDISILKAEIYDPKKDLWVPIADLHRTPSATFLGLDIKGKMKVFYFGSSIVQILDPLKLDWTVEEDHSWLLGPAAVVHDVLHYIVDGVIFRQEGESTKAVCTTTAPESKEKVFAIKGIGEEIYVIGYYRNNYETYVDALTVGTDRPTWRKIAPLPRSIGIILGCTVIKV